LKEVRTLKAALISVEKPGQASAAAMQCLAEFGIYHDHQMTPQEAHHVTLCPQWKIVLNAMIESRRNELQCKGIKQDRWNNREADRQAEKAFLEEHKGPGKFSGKYGPQPTQTELVWRMPWGCWLEYNNDRMLSEAWNAATEEFSEDWSTWHSKADSASTPATQPVAEAAVSSTALFNATNSVGGYTAGTLGAMMYDCVKWVFTGQQALKQAQERQTVLELAKSKRQDAPSCPLLKFITTEASQGGVIALTTTKITRQHGLVSFSRATACRQILWSDGPWTGREIEPAWENHYESQGYKPTATCKECGFKKLCVLTSLKPTEVPPPPPSPASNMSCQKAAFVHKDSGPSLR